MSIQLENKQDIKEENGLWNFLSSWATPLIASGSILVYDMYLNPIKGNSILKIPWINLDVREEYVNAISAGLTIGATNLVNKNLIPLIIPKVDEDRFIHDAIEAIGPLESIITGTATSFLISYVDKDLGKVPQVPNLSQMKIHSLNGIKFATAHLFAKSLNDIGVGGARLLWDSIKMKK